MGEVLHQQSPPGIEWTRVNTAEAQPGVLTPLSWTVWNRSDESGEVSYTLAYRALRMEPRRSKDDPSAWPHYKGIFYGRPALNMTRLRKTLSLLPGNLGAQFEADFYNSQPVSSASGQRLRRARVGVALAVYALVARRRLKRLRVASQRYWEAKLVELGSADLGAARAIMREAMDRFAIEVAEQIKTSTLINVAVAGLRAELRRCDGSDRELTIIGGYGETEEIEVACAIWEAARGDGSVDDVLARYGFHGLAEGELSSASWREDRSALDHLLAGFRSAPDVSDPRAGESRRRAARQAAEAELLSAQHGVGRLRLRLMFKVAARVIPLRVIAKAAFTQTFDVLRATARVIGQRLVEQGLLDSADDVFLLTYDEAVGAIPILPGAVAERREQCAAYADVDIPQSWTGDPEPFAVASADQVIPDGEQATVIQALGASPGVVEGRTRVVTKPDEVQDLEAGEVLVCHATDPSWASLFTMASAAVIDIGGMMSHGAIVARELGIPCVINTKTGTRQLRTGVIVRVDGDQGLVTVLP